MLKAIVVDDEKHCVDALVAMLQNRFQKEVALMGTATSVPEGIQLVEEMNPDVVFLDIEMPPLNGFDLLLHFNSIGFEVIFTTAHEKYALNAIKFHALDYLLKPFSVEELRSAIEKCSVKLQSKRSSETLNNLLQNLKAPALGPKKIALPTSKGFQYVPVNEIIRLESDSNYTWFFLSNGQKHLIAKTLKEFQDILEDYDFFRIHNSHLINLAFVTAYTSADGDMVTLSNNDKVEVSRRRKAEFLERLNRL